MDTRQPVTASDLMTGDVATCAVGDSLDQAARLMWERPCGCLAVVDPRGAPVGLLTERDVAMAAYTQRRRLDDIRVEVAMSWPPLTCAPTATLEDVQHLLEANAARRLVVVDRGRIQGLITVDDLVHHAAHADQSGEGERTPQALGEASGEEPVATDGGAIEFAQNCLAVLQTVRQEIHADLGLASDEMRERWRGLERRLRVAEKRFQATRVQATKNLLALVDSAREFQRILRETVSPGRTLH